MLCCHQCLQLALKQKVMSNALPNLIVFMQKLGSDKRPGKQLLNNVLATHANTRFLEIYKVSCKCIC